MEDEEHTPRENFSVGGGIFQECTLKEKFYMGEFAKIPIYNSFDLSYFSLTTTQCYIRRCPDKMVWGKLYKRFEL